MPLLHFIKTRDTFDDQVRTTIDVYDSEVVATRIIKSKLVTITSQHDNTIGDVARRIRSMHRLDDEDFLLLCDVDPNEYEQL